MLWLYGRYKKNYISVRESTVTSKVGPRAERVNTQNMSHASWVLNPLPAKLCYLNFHPLEVVSRYRDSQLQVGENCSYLFNFRPHFIFTNLDV